VPETTHLKIFPKVFLDPADRLIRLRAKDQRLVWNVNVNKGEFMSIKKLSVKKIKSLKGGYGCTSSSAYYASGPNKGKCTEGV